MTMALRNQPYFPLYVNDFLSDEKLILCSAESTGVYIRIMCLMHKSDEYGVILLKQKFKQSSKQTSNFALQLAIFLPYTSDVIERSLDDLVDNNVLHIDGDRMIQSRMVKDEKISQTRALSGSKGGKKSVESRSLKRTSSAKLASSFAQPNIQANAEDEIEYESEDNIESEGAEKIENNGDRFFVQTPSPKAVKDAIEKVIDECLLYLNTVSGKSFKITTESNRKFVRARISEDYTMDDFKRVIDNQWLKWKDTDMEEYMRPSTLFNAEKFQSYINAPDYSKQAVPKFQNKAGRFEQIDFDKIEV